MTVNKRWIDCWPDRDWKAPYPAPDLSFKAQPKPTAEAQAQQQDPAIKLPQVTVQDRRENYAVTSATTATKIDAPIMDIPQSIESCPIR
jgi:outer membrane receptor for ferric coprogen and ferric-rhodotorulic acid